MDPSWHDAVEECHCVEEAVALVRRFLSGLTDRDRALLPRNCAPELIHGDDDIDELTYKLAQLQREAKQSKWSSALLDEVFAYFLHASLHIARLNRVRANNSITLLPRPQAQMR